MYIRSPRSIASPCEYKESNECNKDWDCLWDYDDKECRKKSPPSRNSQYSGKPIFNPTQLNLSSIKNIYSFTSNDIIDRYHNDPEKLLNDILHDKVPEQEIVRLLNYLPDDKTWFTDKLMDIVDTDLILESGNWGMIQRTNALYAGRDMITSISRLIRGGHLDILKYFVTNEMIPSDHLENFAWMYMRAAASYGHLDMLKYLDLFNNERIYVSSLIGASQNGHLDVVQYIVSLGTIDSNDIDEAFIEAVENNHLDVIQYLISVGADVHAFQDVAIQIAVERGYFDVTQYLISVGADIYRYINLLLPLAFELGHTDIANYLASL